MQLIYFIKFKQYIHAGSIKDIILTKWSLHEVDNGINAPDIDKLVFNDIYFYVTLLM